MSMRCLLILLIVGMLPIANLHATQSSQVTASHAWIRLLPANLPASGYVNLHNAGASAATLVSAHSAVYASVMLHQSSMDAHGMNNMTAVAQMSIPAHGSASLAPAGYHLMLGQPSHPLKPGDTVDITLDFADGSQLPVSFLLRPANAADPE
ncbi:copper chaperone PCu(A)C [Dyella acidiphila]|uniref:Copper chaperone PCu(A)C n=1 Tax=Dyella acidiphila TaxID=2775866 RepID=A0ABR9GCH6_9GAMM|nr:copper chaperone PCu(A)C [Dyella acidiphila]MBE1161679.1 copper chaperone PCu(A)C [Dyella acidiphila]